MSRPSAIQLSDYEQQSPNSKILGTPSSIIGMPNRDLCIVDSQNHCLWIVEKEGKVRYRIGRGEKGHKDGHINDALFDSPESVAVFHDSLFVADTGNNLLREIKLNNASVTTIATPILSPVDIYEFQEKLFIISSTGNTIHILDPIRKNQEVLNSPNVLRPSGLSSNGETLFFCDIKSNSLMSWDGKKTQVLFQAKSTEELNKPMSLSYGGNQLYIADTYNHQIKIFSLTTGELTPLIGSANPGNKSGTFTTSQMKHPTNVFVSGMSLYICDRGNNEVKLAELLLSKLRTFKVHR